MPDLAGSLASTMLGRAARSGAVLSSSGLAIWQAVIICFSGSVWTGPLLPCHLYIET